MSTTPIPQITTGTGHSGLTLKQFSIDVLNPILQALEENRVDVENRLQLLEAALLSGKTISGTYPVIVTETDVSIDISMDTSYF